MGSKSSSSTSANTTNQYDQRAITTIDDRDTSSTSNLTWDSSNRSVNNITTSDPGAVRLGEINAQLMGAVAAGQSDAVKTVAGLGVEAFKDLSATTANTFGANERAWSHTIDASAGVLDKLLTTAASSTDAAKALASQAISSYQPADAKAGDAMKYGAIALAVVGGFLLLNKA